MNYLNGTILDGCLIRIEIDKGFREGRQFGRGATGGQVRPVACARGCMCVIVCTRFCSRKTRFAATSTGGGPSTSQRLTAVKAMLQAVPVATTMASVSTSPRWPAIVRSGVTVGTVATTTVTVIVTGVAAAVGVVVAVAGVAAVAAAAVVGSAIGMMATVTATGTGTGSVAVGTHVDAPSHVRGHGRVHVARVLHGGATGAGATSEAGRSEGGCAYL